MVGYGLELFLCSMLWFFGEVAIAGSTPKVRLIYDVVLDNFDVPFVGLCVVNVHPFDVSCCAFM